MEAAEKEVQACLPIRARITEVTLLIQSEDSSTWEPHTRLTLANPTTS